MELRDYPRPAEDTGIGVHWRAGAVAPEIVEAFWLGELIELGVKWVKIGDQRGAKRLARTLLTAEIMPVVEIAREAPGPGAFSAAELEAVEDLVAAGVRYFAFDSEPDRAAHWGRAGAPADALALTARAAAANMAAILERGGMPAIPALTPEGDWRLVEEIARAGGDALFDEPVWLAIHNDTSIWPPGFPDNADGDARAPRGREFYAALAAEAWQGGPLAEIDDPDRRMADSGEKPSERDGGATAGDGPAGWRAKLDAALAERGEGQPETPQPKTPLPRQRARWRALEALNEEAARLIGRSLPILSTASGYLMNERAHARDPATTPALHTAQTLEICRAMMGTSRYLPPAPDYYFCTAFCLLAHDALQSEGSVDERNAWYGPLHPEERREESGEEREPPAGPAPVAETFGWSTRPIVPLLKAEPKQPRPRGGSTPAAPVPRWRDGTRPAGDGVLSGKVRGGAGARVRLTHRDGFAYESIARTNGVYRFVDLPAGRYSLEVTDPAGSREEALDIGPGQEIARDLAAYGWGYEIEQRPAARGRMLTFGVEGLANDDAGALALRISDSRGEGRVAPLARSTQGQTASCEVGPLDVDSYRLEPLGLPNSGPAPLQCRVPIDQGMATDVQFVYAHDEKRAAPRASAISGTVEGGAGCTVRLRAEESGAGPSERFAEADGDGRYAFSGLPAGRYYVDVMQRRLLSWPGPLALDGRNRPRCDLALLPEETLPAPRDPAALQGQTQPVAAAGPTRVTQPAGGGAPAARLVALVDARGQRYVTQVDPAGEFRFESLPAGDYDLYADVYGSRGIHLEAGDRLSIQMWQDEAGWSQHVRIRTAASRPGMIRVQWTAGTAVTFTVMDAGSGEAEQSEAEENRRWAEFGPLPPGVYLAHSPELGVGAEVALAAGEAAVVSFVRL